MQITKINYLYIFIILLWLPIQTIILGITTTKVPAFLTLIVSAINIKSNSKFRQVLFSKPVIFWGLWVIYSIINSYVKGVHYKTFTYGAMITEIIVAFVIMVITIIEYSKDSP